MHAAAGLLDEGLVTLWWRVFRCMIGCKAFCRQRGQQEGSAILGMRLASTLMRLPDVNVHGFQLWGCRSLNVWSAELTQRRTARSQDAAVHAESYVPRQDVEVWKC